MIRKTIRVYDNFFRKFEDPLGNSLSRKYIFYVKAGDVPDGIPMATNPRDQKLRSCRKIKLPFLLTNYNISITMFLSHSGG